MYGRSRYGSRLGRGPSLDGEERRRRQDNNIRYIGIGGAACCLTLVQRVAQGLQGTVAMAETAKDPGPPRARAAAD
jgi:hypothetical protein